jgi:competence protein ComEA
MNRFTALLAGLCMSFGVFAAQPVNINSADAVTIADALNGIGLAKAKLIVDYRTAHGAFKSMDELTNVKGIGLKTVEKNRDYIKLGGGAPAKAAAK